MYCMKILISKCLLSPSTALSSLFLSISTGEEQNKEALQDVEDENQ